tara:strand:- start:8007 stop:9497 length:1491 start_codon:yes stop_codon:yes gene_type:complete
MTIPVSSVVNVSIAIGATFPVRAGFGTLNIVTEETGVIGITERIRSYSNLDGVAADWGSTTEVLKAATAYFGQQPKPTSLKVSTRYSTDQSAELRGGSVVDDATNLAIFNAITDGSFAISIDVSPKEDILALDFSADTNMSDIAVTIQTALQAIATGGYTAAICTYDGSRFFVTSGTTGVSSTIKFLTTVHPSTGTDISSLLQMQQGEGTKSDGIDAETITASLDAIQNIDPDWYGLLFTKEVRDGVVINTENAVVAAAAWCEARVKVFGNTSNDLDVLDSVTTNDIASTLQTANYRRTMTTFSSFVDQYPSASILGRAFTVNFNQADSTITLKFKQMPGITVEALTQNQKAVLDSKSANALIVVGASDMFAESFMANGVFFDEVHGVDWLTNAVETNVFGYLLTRTTKVPYTNKGIAALEQQVTKALDEAVRNGLIAAGETIDGEFLGTGYKITTIPAEDINQSDKEARLYPGLSFVVLGAGAIHSVQINGVFER